jgi:hypothetical protein
MDSSTINTMTNHTNSNSSPIPPSTYSFVATTWHGNNCRYSCL